MKKQLIASKTMPKESKGCKDDCAAAKSSKLSSKAINTTIYEEMSDNGNCT